MGGQEWRPNCGSMDRSLSLPVPDEVSDANFVKLLAARGAAVVVNDIGSVDDGPQRTRTASQVAADIRGSGGRATADFHNVVDTAPAIVEAARMNGDVSTLS